MFPSAPDRVGAVRGGPARLAAAADDVGLIEPFSLDQMWPMAGHHVERYPKNRVEANHA